jgi:hypothetical protein
MLGSGSDLPPRAWRMVSVPLFICSCLCLDQCCFLYVDGSYRTLQPLFLSFPASASASRSSFQSISNQQSMNKHIVGPVYLDLSDNIRTARLRCPNCRSPCPLLALDRHRVMPRSGNERAAARKKRAKEAKRAAAKDDAKARAEGLPPPSSSVRVLPRRTEVDVERWACIRDALSGAVSAVLPPRELCGVVLQYLAREVGLVPPLLPGDLKFPSPTSCSISWMASLQFHCVGIAARMPAHWTLSYCRRNEQSVGLLVARAPPGSTLSVDAPNLLFSSGQIDWARVVLHVCTCDEGVVIRQNGGDSKVSGNRTIPWPASEVQSWGSKANGSWAGVALRFEADPVRGTLRCSLNGLPLANGDPIWTAESAQDLREAVPCLRISQCCQRDVKAWLSGVHSNDWDID